MTDSGIPIRQGSLRQTSVEVGGWCVTDVVFPPWLKLPSHYHARACFAVILEGSVDKTFSSAAYPSPPSTLVTMPPGERHVDQFEKCGAHLLVIEPVGADVDRLEPWAGVFDRLHHYRDAGLTGTAWRAAHEIMQPDTVSSLVIEGLALEMLGLAARRTHAIPAERRPPPWLASAEEYLRATFDQSIALADAAAAVGVHPVHLARVFRQFYNVTPGEYVRQVRLDWAAAQLATSADQLAYIARRAGFSDQSHFTRAFKRYAGLTPAQYRASIRALTGLDRAAAHGMNVTSGLPEGRPLVTFAALYRCSGVSCVPRCPRASPARSGHRRPARAGLRNTPPTYQSPPRP